MFRDCLSNTTVHGIPQLVNEKNNALSKLIWIVIILASTGTFVYHSTSLIQKYLQKDTYVSLSLDSKEFIIPDIYICNNRPFSYALMEKLHSENNSTFLELINYVKNNQDHFYSVSHNHNLPGYSKKQILEMLGNRNYTDCIRVTYNGLEFYPCSEVLDQVIDINHGYCYKLIDKYKHLIYQQYKLAFLLYTDEYGEKYVYLEDSVHLYYGHTVYFTIPGYAPNSDSAKANIKRGRYTEIEVTMTFHDKLNQKKKPCQENAKYGTHVFDWNEPDSLKFSYLIKGYDLANQELHRQMLNKCNCSWATIPLDINNADQFHNKMCGDKVPINDLSCIDDMFNTKYFLPQSIQFDPCRMPIYRPVYESAQLPDFVTSEMFSQFNNTLPDSMKKEYDRWKMNNFTNPVPEKLKNSFSVIYINAPKHSGDLWKENLSYELKDLLADIGGILGFYLGVSMVSLLEIVAYIPNHCINTLRR